MLFAARSAAALHRLLDVLPVFAGDDRISRRFALVPGSEFGVDALAAVERAGARTIPWEEARRSSYDVILAASPKGELELLRGTRVLLPHGAGFSKTLRGEGSGESASGLDPAYLLPAGGPLAAFHALAHPRQIAQLAALSPAAATRAATVGDPTLERLLDSRSHRDAYRDALGTGARKLIVLTSTWGPESLLRRRPELPARLAAGLPQDGYQLALTVHPNEHSRLGTFDLAQQLAPAREAGLVLAEPYEGWAAILVAADAVITDHGSTALYAAALGRPVIGAYDGGEELIPGSPMAELLARSPRLAYECGSGTALPEELAAALRAHRPDALRDIADSAFAGRGQALGRLRAKLYQLLGLPPRTAPVVPRLLPAPAPPSRTPAAYGVRAHLGGAGSARIRVERFPAYGGPPAHYLAVEHGRAHERHAQSAGLLYRRPARPPAAPHQVVWTAGGWTAHALDAYPQCRTAAVVLSHALCVVRVRDATRMPLLAVRIDPCREDGRLVYADPAAVLCAVHAWLATPTPYAPLPGEFSALIGARAHRVRLTAATAAEEEHTG